MSQLSAEERMFEKALAASVERKRKKRDLRAPTLSSNSPKRK